MIFFKNATKNIAFILASMLCLSSLNAFGQKIEDQIKSINSIDEANQFILVNENIDAQIWTIAPQIDENKSSRIFKNRTIGDIFSDGTNLYKIIDSRKTVALRVSYIFLDGNKMSLQAINDLRKKIVNQYKNGAKFSDLANQYTMDSAKDGDLSWFTEGTMVKEFETAIKKHNKNDIFTIDLTKENWYYVALKTYQDQIVEELTILKVKS